MVGGECVRHPTSNAASINFMIDSNLTSHSWTTLFFLLLYFFANKCVQESIVWFHCEPAFEPIYLIIFINGRIQCGTRDINKMSRRLFLPPNKNTSKIHIFRMMDYHFGYMLMKWLAWVWAGCPKGTAIVDFFSACVFQFKPDFLSSWIL